MSAENSHKTLIGLRESTQSVGVMLNQWVDAQKNILSPKLPAPCRFIADNIPKLFQEIQKRPDIMVEFPNPISGPSTTMLTFVTCDEAKRYEVLDQVALHTRMKIEDVIQAGLCGATRVHLFGNCSDIARNNGGGKSVVSLLGELNQIIPRARDLGIQHIRTSLEHATETDPFEVQKFIKGLTLIKQKNPLVTGLGLPDTNGLATPGQYQRLLEKIYPTLADSGLTLYVHLHNDKLRALANAKAILEFCSKHNIHVVIETVDPNYPGERVGVRPTYDELIQLGLPSVPNSTNSLISGSTWVLDASSLADSGQRQHASQFNVAGVHTNAPLNYSLGNREIYPHPGIYSIMGTGNLSFLLENLGLHSVNKEVLRAGALIAREIGAQFGHLDQGHAIALIKFITAEPDLILQIASNFGPPKEWLIRPPPDIRGLYGRIEEMARIDREGRVDPQDRHKGHYYRKTGRPPKDHSEGLGLTNEPVRSFRDFVQRPLGSK